MREVGIVVGFINHPLLIAEAFDYLAELELPEGELSRLRSAVLDVAMTAAALDRQAILSALEGRGLRGVFDALEARVRANRDWMFLAEAAVEDAREALRQALHLQHRQRFLHRELRNAEVAFAAEQTEQAYAQIVAIKQEMDNLAGTEALIDGFGLLSGRPARSI